MPRDVVRSLALGLRRAAGDGGAGCRGSLAAALLALRLQRRVTPGGGGSGGPEGARRSSDFWARDRGKLRVLSCGARGLVLLECRLGPKQSFPWWAWVS